MCMLVAISVNSVPQWIGVLEMDVLQHLAIACMFALRRLK